MRREWIEIHSGINHPTRKAPSPSMRREWIEIAQKVGDIMAHGVSLHAEGVD